VDSNHLPPRCWAPSGLLPKLGGRSKCPVLSGVLHVRCDLLQTSDVDLVAASTMPFLTPRAAFGPSRKLDDEVFSIGHGIYLWVGNHLGPNQPVHDVCWAKSDFWAVFLWGPLRTSRDNPHDKAEGPPAPSLTAFGLPDPLEFAVTMSAMQALRKGQTWPPVQSASYRISADGSLISNEITDGRITIHYERANPRKRDLPVAIEIGLEGPGKPKEVLIAQSQRGRRMGIFPWRKR
jgi:hypothetical protein